MNAELIYNPYGGQVVIRQELKAVMAFLSCSGWAVTCQETTGPGEATEMARRAVQNGAEVVIAAGGDGTVSEVANGLLRTDVALGVLPVGTSNAWALQMGIPSLNPLLPSTGVVKLMADIEERIERPVLANYYRKALLDAARVLVEGRTESVDVGNVSGRHFLMWAGIGLDAAVLEKISPKEKKALGFWAYLLAAMGSADQCSGKEVRLILDGKMITVNTPLVVVSNIQLYGGVIPIGAKARVNDAKLDVCIFKGEGPFTIVQHTLKVLSRQHLQDPQIEYYQCSEIGIESAQRLPVQVDGDLYAETPVSIRVSPLALKVIVPQNAPADLFGL
jgi:diacylglycerol kinase (ATP)